MKSPGKETARHEPIAVSKAKLEMIEACGRASQIIGLPRSTGQIYGLLYLSTRPICLIEIAETLQLSKASCSTGTRDLCAWNAIRQVWIHGDRKDHFEVEGDVLNLLKTIISRFIEPRFGSSQTRLERVAQALEEDKETAEITPEEFKILTKRLEQLQRLRRKIASALPLAEKLLSGSAEFH